MPENLASIVLSSLMLGLWLWVIVRLLMKGLKSKYGPVKTVKAKVVDKQIIETFSKYSGNGKHEKYVIVFFVDGRKKSFYVSQFSYGGYRVNEEGTLTYKGDKLIEFR